MNNIFRFTLLILGLILLIKEFFLGIPGLGGTYILSTGWAPLVTNLVLYAIMMGVMVVDRYGRSKELLWVPIMGMVFSVLAFIPLIGMMLHWLLTFILIFFIIRVLSMPNQIGKTHVYYGGDDRDTINRR